MNVTAVALHAALLALMPLAALSTARRSPARLAWPAAGLCALLCASATSAGSPVRAVVGIAIAVAADAGRSTAVVSAVAAGGFVSLAAGVALGLALTGGYTLYAVATALIVLGPSVLRLKKATALERTAATTAIVAVCVPLLDFLVHGGTVAPWLTLPHALALVACAAMSGESAPGRNRALADRLERLEREAGFVRGLGAVAVAAAAAVHELKNLLNDVALAARFGLSQADPAVKDRALALLDETAGEGGVRVLALLEDLQRGGREAASDCAVGALLEGVRRRCRPAEGSSIMVAAPPGAVVRVRSVEVELALSCLLRNALSASRGRGGADVALQARGAEGTVEIDVLDSAGGLRLDQRAGVFEPPADGRAGLGLALALRLIEQNGGRLEYLSAQGASCFRVTLPGRVDERPVALV
jgi:signal transduction histidine kinase